MIVDFVDALYRLTVQDQRVIEGQKVRQEAKLIENTQRDMNIEAVRSEYIPGNIRRL